MIVFFFFKQKTAYEMRISDWSSDVCSSDLSLAGFRHHCPTTSRPIERAVPTIICVAASTSFAFRSTIFCVAISRHCATVTRPAVVLPVVPERFWILAAFLRKKLAGGAFVTQVNDLSWHRSEEHTSELPSLMRTSYAVSYMKQQKHGTR